MFLNHLSDTNKEHFVELAYKLAYSNNDYPEAQRKLLTRYKEKCGLSFIPNTATKEELMACFGKQEEVVKRIVYYEIYMLLLSDDQIDADEKKVLGEMQSAFNLSKEEAEKIQEQGMLVKQANQDLKKLLGV